MGIAEREWALEEQRLARVIAEIGQQLAKAQGSTELFNRHKLAVRRSMWDEFTLAPQSAWDTESLVMAKQYLDNIKIETLSLEFYRQLVRRLERMYEAPYFGRIDFREAGAERVEEIYIGISNLMEEASGEYLVYDWRAPVSSMFYDYEIGEAKYRCPEYDLAGDLLLKRQYRITDGQINYMFDSSLKIDDDILQEILGKSADNRMRTIIASIQREQNKIIRDDSHQLLIVQGAAGSGKTSIALHRVAYLLYKYRDTMKAENIVIFSPNEIFNDYISSVLPELGEENMYQTTFQQYAQKFLAELELEDMNDQMEYLLSARNEPGYTERLSNIKYKTSPEFLNLLRRFERYLEEEDRVFTDVIYEGEVLVSKEELNDLYRQKYTYLPLSKRLGKMRQRVLILLRPYQKKRFLEIAEQLKQTQKRNFTRKYELKARARIMVAEEFKPLKDELKAMTEINLHEVYGRLFADEELFRELAGEEVPEEFVAIKRQTLEQLQVGRLWYEDVAPLLFMRGIVEGTPETRGIKHVFVDEVQDYTPLQFAILKQLFPRSNWTMLGDLNQSINAYMRVGNYERITEVFDIEQAAMINLSRSYRSTREITTFARALLKGAVQVEYFHREGVKPEVRGFAEEEEFYTAVVTKIREMKAEGCNSIGVICKTAGACVRVHAGIANAMHIFGERDWIAEGGKDGSKASGSELDVVRITKDDDRYTRGVVAIPVYLAKGLEFDGVLVVNTEKDNYCIEDERLLLYTACTRALHQLGIFYLGEKSPFLAEVDADLYVESVRIGLGQIG